MPERPRLIIAIDFDGTIAEACYPDIGPAVPGAVETIAKWQRDGHYWVLFTMREGERLFRAAEWLGERGLRPYGVNRSPKASHTESKLQAHIYIDDLAIGCPLRRGSLSAMCVDWSAVSALVDKYIVEVERGERVIW